MIENKDVRPKILKFLNSLPRSDFEVSGPGSPTGKPDITGVLDGRYVAVETKILGKDAMRHQAYRIWKLRKAGAVAFVARSVEETKRGLRDGGIG
jgi:hypothetical protein